MENNMKRLLITDLDDTLYDWLGFFIPSFYAMVDEVVKITGISKEILIQEYKTKHQHYGSVEYPFVTLELPSVLKKYKDLTTCEIKEVLSEAFHRFNSVRKEKLKLYEGVENTLKELFENNVVIIGYTESSQENGFYRLKKLGIEKYFKTVYVSSSNYENNYPVSEKIKVVSTKKPNKEVLLNICNCEQCSTDETIYIGDSLTKDIYMANMANITSVLITHPKEKNDFYSRLVEITSWTDEDFIREENIKEECKTLNIGPDYVIDSFYDLTKIFKNN